jgi:hypothetical protein
LRRPVDPIDAVVSWFLENFAFPPKNVEQLVDILALGKPLDILGLAAQHLALTCKQYEKLIAVMRAELIKEAESIMFEISNGFSSVAI